MGEPAAWSRCEGGVIVAVRVTPKGGRDAVAGRWIDGAGRAFLALRVSAAASEGAANAAACATLAKALGVAKGDVTVRGGVRSREKRLMVRGDPDRIAAALRNCLDQD